MFIPEEITQKHIVSLELFLQADYAIGGAEGALS